ncbi:MAG: phage tail length tape measure family protein [Geminicoccaceae bacterium]|nr:phage tail length tape measure family protein [Geminicoccaceae bacterium]
MATFSARVAELHADLRLDTSQYAQQLDRAEQQMRRSSQQIAQAGVGMSNRSRAALQNMSFQVADIAVQLEAGVSPARVFAQQGSQIAAAWGPVGAAIGAVIAIGVPLAALLLDWATGADEASASLDDVAAGLERFNQLTPTAIADAERLISAFGEMSDSARELARQRLEINITQAEVALAEARNSIDETANRFRIFVEQVESFGDNPELAAGLRPVVEAFQGGDFQRARDLLTEFVTEGQQVGNTLGGIAQESLAAAEEALKATEALDQLNKAREAIQRGSTLGRQEFGPPEAPQATPTPTRTATGRSARSTPTGLVQAQVEALEAELRILSAVEEERGAIRAVMQAQAAAQREGRELTLDELAQVERLAAATERVKVQEEERLRARRSLTIESAQESLAFLEPGIDIESAQASLAFLREGEIASAGIRANLYEARIEGAQIAGLISSELASAVSEADNLGDLFGNLGEAVDNVARRILDMVIEMALFASIMRGFSALGFGGISFGAVPFASGGVISGGRIMPAAAGGILSGPTFIPAANGTVLAGEAGDEGILPLSRIGGQLGVSAAGMGGAHVEVNVINNAAGTEARTEDRGNGRFDIIIDQVVAKNINTGGSQTSKALSLRGLKPSVGKV